MMIVRICCWLTLGSEHAALDFPEVFRSAETEPAIQDRGNRRRQLGARAFGDHPFGARSQIGSHHLVDRHAGYTDQIGKHPDWNALRSAKFRIVPKPAQGADDLLIAQKIGLGRTAWRRSWRPLDLGLPPSESSPSVTHNDGEARELGRPIRERTVASSDGSEAIKFTSWADPDGARPPQQRN